MKLTPSNTQPYISANDFKMDWIFKMFILVLVNQLKQLKNAKKLDDICNVVTGIIQIMIKHVYLNKSYLIKPNYRSSIVHKKQKSIWGNFFWTVKSFAN